MKSNLLGKKKNYFLNYTKQRKNKVIYTEAQQDISIVCRVIDPENEQFKQIECVV